MPKRVFLAILTLLLAFYQQSIFGQEIQTQEIEVTNGYISSDSARPISNSNSIPMFNNDVGRLYAVVQMNGQQEDSQIKHLWFLGDHIILESTRSLRNDQTKTLSSLMIKPNWIGKWRVDVTSSDGTLLYTIPFIIHKRPEATESKTATNPTMAPVSIPAR